ncbi:restriction endonuclease [Bacillus wiedmannii]|uniref:restriction endonuclease n=1 Tax=Bacillus wiedmannii TaxID=1890302 RepID=UPI0007DB46C0|nr:restriction endonuclease [Bacillus wiedmannii]OAK34654.1 hypothetical protein A6285_09005 [Bacillus wiedmannii]HDR7662880.1 restriction endonuclease [Bacillus wiedmannii]
MLFDEKDIDFQLLDGTAFENLCYELLDNNGFFGLKWIKGGGDRGRDIEATKNVPYTFLGTRAETWHFECKNHNTGIGVGEVHDKIGWAFANNPDKLIFLVSTHLTSDCKQYIETMRNSRFKHIYYIEGATLKKILLNTPILIEKYFINHQRKILINSIREFAATGILLENKKIQMILEEENILTKYELNELIYLLICGSQSSIYSDFWKALLNHIKSKAIKTSDSLLMGYTPDGPYSFGLGEIRNQTPKTLHLTPEELELGANSLLYISFYSRYYSDEKISYFQMFEDDNSFLEILIPNKDMNNISINLTSKEYYNEFIANVKTTKLI